MASSQAGDIRGLAPYSVPNDANYSARAEAILGGFTALPSGSGPPTVAQIPLIMRRVGAMAYSPADAKFWQLRGGTADANWVELVGMGAPAAIAFSAWYVDATSGSDSNDGSLGNPLATSEELAKRLNPAGAKLALTSNVAVYFSAGTYGSLELSVSPSVSALYFFDIFGAVVTSA